MYNLTFQYIESKRFKSLLSVCVCADKVNNVVKILTPKRVHLGSKHEKNIKLILEVLRTVNN